MIKGWGLLATVALELGLALGAVAIGAQAQTKPSPKPQPSPQPSPQDQRHQMAEFYRTHYAKHEYRIPMRDGAKLYTVVYTPIAGQFKDPGPYPFLMSRTPYSCANYDNKIIEPHVTGNQTLIHDGYILVCQDVRGRWESEGTWFEMTPAKDGKGIDESTDMYDTVDWLLKNVPANNGKVGILGISYPGFYTAASIEDGHPAIKAASPQAPIIDLWMGDDAYHGGAFMLDANHAFYAPFFAPQKNPLSKAPKSAFEFPTKDMYAFYLQMGTLAHLDSPAGGTNPYFHDQVIHDTYDNYAQIRNLAPHMHRVKAAVLDVGGWFDAEDLAGPVKVFHAIDELSPDAPENTLVEGPWVHGGWSRGTGAKLGDISFGDEPSTFYRDNIEAPFFNHWLKDLPWTPLPKAYTFETGTDVWKKYDAWPPKIAVAKTLYLEPNNGLGWTAPTEPASKDDYVSDPAHPVPFVPYVTGPDVPQRYMDEDQRFATRRSDVLVYETAPLTEDVTVLGPIKPHLKIASTATDSDFIVKLIDVYPEDYKAPGEATEGKHVTGAPPVFLGGYQMLIRGEPFRAKFRNSWEDPQPLTPGKITDINFIMQDINHTFLKGHRIMVQIQSSWFPLVDRNPQVFEDIAKAKPGDFQKATETVFHQANAASSLELLILPH
ncbi:MAG TPA: CocE/NonD family hydrolase [Acidobacteriaceae bacterium]